jgi:hypothetical protein
MWRELMQRMRIARRLADLWAWGLIAGVGLLVVAWCAEHGPAVIGRVAAWSSSAPDVSRPPQPAKLGPWKRAHLDRIAKAVAAARAPSPAGAPCEQGPGEPRRPSPAP